MTRPALVLITLATLAAVGCDRPIQAEPVDQNSEPSAVAPIIDSILTPGEALRRFQSTLTAVKVLNSSIRSRDTLVARFISAIESGDSIGLKRLLVSKNEYAFLYFPTSRYTRKPYELPPDIAWLLSEQNSLKGFTRVTRRLGARPLGFLGYQCGGAVSEGENRFWRACEVSYTDPATGLAVTKKLFGTIMERGGAYKFLSYASDF